MSSDSSSQKGEYFQGDPSYPVFPHARYISKFYVVISTEAGLTKLDVDLYNRCYLPYNPLSYYDTVDRRRSVDDNEDKGEGEGDPNAPRPNYQIDEPPCKRTGSISTNCYLNNTNGTFPGLRPYEDEDDAWDVQQQCYCEKYPYFDSMIGCNECFRLHGGIEGYHWFPQSYLAAASSSYCNADPITTGFFPFVSQWHETDPAAAIATTNTAPNVLGTETAASLYYTYNAASAATGAPSSAGRQGVNRVGLLTSVAVALSLIVLSGI